MTHKDILKMFNKLFPTIKVNRWWKKGTNTIRIRTDFINIRNDIFFTRINSLDWKIETKGAFESVKNCKKKNRVVIKKNRPAV